MNKLILILLVVLVGVIATLFWAPVDSSWISAVIALAALLVSLISAFKDEIFPFQLSVLADEVIFAPPTAPSHDSPALILAMFALSVEFLKVSVFSIGYQYSKILLKVIHINCSKDLFPLVFMNDGNGSGVVEALSIKIEGNNSTKVYTPIAEIDFGKYMTLLIYSDFENQNTVCCVMFKYYTQYIVPIFLRR